MNRLEVLNTGSLLTTRVATEKLVYLAGPIAGLTYDQATDWRTYVAQELRPPVVALSPMRAKDYLQTAGVLGKSGWSGNPLSTGVGITARDRFDCWRADVVLFNFLGAKDVSIGTCIEVGWADAARRPMVAAIEPDNVHRHGILTTVIPYIVQTLDDAIDIVHAILLP